MEARKSQDYRVTIPAGGTITLNVGGDWISHRSGDELVISTPAGDKMTLQTGTGARFGAPFDSVDLFNPAGTAATAELFVGFGEFRGSLLSGTVGVTPPADLATAADYAHAGASTDEVAAANPDRVSITIGNLTTSSVSVRVGDSNTGAARGYELAPGQGFKFNTRGAVYVYASAAANISIVEEIN